MRTMNRKDRILDILQTFYKMTIIDLAGVVGAPEASIRRDIQGLRREGHNISCARDGVYAYRPPTV